MFYVEEGTVFLIDKPIDWTSFDTVNFIRSLFMRFYGIRKLKVGHAGTLDPLATGLLILCTGPMTKQIEDFQAQVKTYTGTMILGQTTPTFDLESEPDNFYPTEGITAEQINQARQQFIGDIKQYPPKYSAIKIKGKRAFDYARSDEEIELKARDIHIDDFKVNMDRFPELDFEVTCSKGTYIRSLANDFGKALNNGACLKTLRRTRIGDFHVEDAWQLEDLKQAIIDSGEEYREWKKQNEISKT
ncbi:MAG: tRNA pseudouridine(55) synthase TruB [Bacteroidales bacterium]|nr:tRNA pseudouridine(55) synthase TruB [Bacteroidales bacterium]